MKRLLAASPPQLSVCCMFTICFSSRGTQKSTSDDVFADVTRVLSRSTNCGSDISQSPVSITSLVSSLQIVISKKTRTTNLLDTENPCTYKPII